MELVGKWNMSDGLNIDSVMATSELYGWGLNLFYSDVFL
jgi:hypothetical protein